MMYISMKDVLVGPYMLFCQSPPQIKKAFGFQNVPWSSTNTHFVATDIAPVLHCHHVVCANTLVEVLVLTKSCVEEGRKTELTRKMVLGESARLQRCPGAYSLLHRRKRRRTQT